MKRMLSIKRDRAFTVADLVIVLATAFLLVMVLPQLMHQPRRRSSRIHCMSNLKQIGVAMRLYASDNDGNYPAKGETKGSTNWGETYLHFKVAGNELSSPRVLICPDDKTRISAVDFSPTNFVGNSNVSYFVALDADATNPNLLLTGDRHLDLPRKTPVLNLASNMFVDWTKEMHFDQRSRNAGGNIGLADGSAQQMSGKRLRASLQNSGTDVQRIMLP